MANAAGGAFGFAPGLTIQKFGYNDGVDETLWQAVGAKTGATLVDENYEDVANPTIVWWRGDDGDADNLTDLLVDTQANLDGAGFIWVLTPKAHTTDAVPVTKVEEAAQAAGMYTTSAAPIGQHWGSIKVSSRGC